MAKTRKTNTNEVSTGNNNQTVVNNGGRTMNTLINVSTINNQNSRLVTRAVDIKLCNCASLMTNIQTIEFAKYAGIKTVSADTFQETHKERGSARERIIANIDRKTIKWGTDYVEAKFMNHENGIKLFYDGNYVRTAHGTTYEKRLPETPKGRVQIRLDCFKHSKNSKVDVETLILLLKDLYYGIMLENYEKNTQCNVISCTANIDTANRLGMDRWLHPDNLEWTYGEDNSKHGGLYTKLYEKTGKNWLASANDSELWAKVSCSSDEIIRKYCEENLFEIIK